MHILPIASGKGGVGKSLVSANVALALAQAGKRVVVADLDLGGSNLHLILGVRGGGGGVGTFLSNPEVEFEQIIVETEYPNLRFIPGEGEIPGIANLSSGQKRKLMNRLRNLDADFLIMDLGAGTSFNVMDFFLMSPQGIVVTTPTPTATVNAYLCLKNAIFRLLSTSFKRKTPAGEFLRDLNSRAANLQRIYIPELLERIRGIDPESHERFVQNAQRLRPRLIMNLVDDPKDAEKINRLRRSCTEYLGIEVEHLGVIYRDDLQDIALSSRLPILVYKPKSVLSAAIYRIADKLIELSTDDKDSLRWSDSEDTFSEAAIEAEIDYDAKVDYIEELLHTGALSHGDLLETVKSQQLEINHLKKENTLLKSKLLKAAQAGFSIR